MTEELKRQYTMSVLFVREVYTGRERSESIENEMRNILEILYVLWTTSMELERPVRDKNESSRMSEDSSLKHLFQALRVFRVCVVLSIHLRSCFVRDSLPLIRKKEKREIAWLCILGKECGR